MVVLSDLPAEVLALLKGPINWLDIRKGLIVIIAVSHLDVPNFAQVKLLQAFGIGDFPVAQHVYKYLRVRQRKHGIFFLFP
jgi:hypothetical protein